MVSASESGASEDLTPELWAALVATPEGAKARATALHDQIILLGDLVDAIDEWTPTDADDADIRVLHGVRLVALASAALIDGVTQVLPGNPYAAAALIRQMVEVEYLAWTCDHDPEELADWLTSDRERRRRRWQPQHMRARAGGVFNDDDYRAHCEIGGHPTPPGISALHALRPKMVWPRGIAGTQSFEALLHTFGAVGHLSRAAAKRHPKLGAAPIRATLIRDAWSEVDPAALWTTKMAEGEDPEGRARVLEHARRLAEAARLAPE